MSWFSGLIDFLMLCLWVRWLPVDKTKLELNVYIAVLFNRMDRLFAFMRQVLPLPNPVNAAILCGVFGLLRAGVWRYLQVTPQMVFGQYFTLTPPSQASAYLIGCSFLMFAVFLVKFWLVVEITALLAAPEQSRNFAARAFRTFCRPASMLPVAAKVVFYPACCAALAVLFAALNPVLTLPVALTAPDAGVHTVQLAALPEFARQIALLSVALAIDALDLLRLILMFALFLNLLTVFLMPGRFLFAFSMDLIDVLMGRFSSAVRFAKGRTPGMGLDFVPLIFFFAVNMLYNSATVGLFKAFQFWIGK